MCGKRKIVQFPQNINLEQKSFRCCKKHRRSGLVKNTLSETLNLYIIFGVSIFCNGSDDENDSGGDNKAANKNRYFQDFLRFPSGRIGRPVRAKIATETLTSGRYSRGYPSETVKLRQHEIES